MVFLVGFMGSGKTSVGRDVAERLGCAFIDLDERIERAAGCSIAEIFERQGEAAFRDLEQQELRRVLEEGRGARAVVALGGGAFAQPRNAEAIDEAGALTVWLDAPADVLLARCGPVRDDRPLARDPERFASLHRGRLPFYARAAVHVDAAQPLPAVVELVLAAIHQSGRAPGEAQA